MKYTFFTVCCDKFFGGRGGGGGRGVEKRMRVTSQKKAGKKVEERHMRKEIKRWEIKSATSTHIE